MAVPTNWQNIPLPEGDDLFEQRSRDTYVFLPNRSFLRASNIFLKRTAFGVVTNYPNLQDLPGRVAAYLATRFNRDIRDFTVALVDPNFGDVIVVCPDSSLRDRLVFSNTHVMEQGSEVNFSAWSFSYNMNYHPTRYQALIRLTGVPLHD